MGTKKHIVFTVTLEQANKIFKGLGKLPFEEVYELIGILNEQANQQFAPKNDISSPIYSVKNKSKKKNMDELSEEG